MIFVSTIKSAITKIKIYTLRRNFFLYLFIEIEPNVQTYTCRLSFSPDRVSKNSNFHPIFVQIYELSYFKLRLF